MEEYIRVNVVPEILRHYNNGNDYELTKCEVKPLENMINNWSSVMYILDLSFVIENDDNYLEQHHSFYVKCMVDHCKVRSYEATKQQFYNEIYFYNTVVPIFKKLFCQKNVKLFPEAPYAVMKDLELKKPTEQADGIVVLENLKTQGYELAAEKYFDMEHSVLATEQLGRWHALSLIVKELNPEKFHDEIISYIENCKWTPQNGEEEQYYFNPFLDRLDKSLKCPENSETFLAMKRLREKCKNIQQYMNITLIESSKRSKLSLICHGDYCRHNILLKYTENKVPVSAIPIDYQNIHYGSPAFDITHLILMNTKKEIRENFFSELIEKYHAALVATMKEILMKETKQNTKEISDILPSLDSIFEEIKLYGVYGMLHAIHFVPIQMGSQDEVDELIDSMIDLNTKEFYDCAMNIGGEAATNTVCEIFDTAIRLNQISID